ncbi:MAG: peptidylprolyl isomerase [Gammaproteobacteria bacterium]|nr:peptidylprolyl isomerase [Gammaproteobacteria bacterium]
MKTLINIATGLLFVLALNLNATQPRGEFIQPDNVYPKVKFETNLGDFVVELDRIKAPITVNNFLSYVDAKRYDNTLFHRLEHDFVLQGGGFTAEMESVDEFPQVINESGNGLKNNLATIAMARQYTPHSATSQFFINLADNDSLNPGRNWGYAVFGSIVEGDEILEKLQDIETDISEELGWPSFPTKKIIIISAKILAE